LFLKVFDAQEEELELTRDGYKSPIPEHLRWRNWAADAEGMTGEGLLDFVDVQLFPKLKTLPGDADRNPRGFVVRGVFEDAYNYMKSGQLLRQVINKLNAIDFNRRAERHQFNDIYEKILKDLQSAGNAGEFYTPRAVTQFMVDIVNPKLGERVLDPACGTGGFLVCAIEHLRKQVKNADDQATLQRSIGGFEKKQLPHMLCVTNLVPHDIEVPSQVVHGNTLEFYEHQYPAGAKNYNKTKPIRIEEFDVEKAWWGSDADNFASRVEGEFAWKVDLAAIKASGFNLDQKNPHAGPQVSHDPDELMAEYRRLQSEAQGIRNQLKSILSAALARQ
jgi:type I restriction-modification system DNA methylase subunit